ncbi:DNA polymerase [Rummeliibacillus stabekisii]|uniref:DNA polymerase n=1 Tax=Rummeliibacillus stabekisii TaxID=241244 RepID=UPI00371BE507
MEEIFIDLMGGHVPDGEAPRWAYQQEEKEKKAMQRVKEAQKKVNVRNYEPTWDELWFTGYPATNGKHKNGIFQTKLSEKDVQKLKEVKQAIEEGTLGTEVESYRKFSKSHALNLYNKLKAMKLEKITQEYIDNIPDNYHTVNNYPALDAVVKELKNALDTDTYFALDTETTGVEFEDRIIGMSFSFKTDVHFYIPIRHITDTPQLEEVKVFKAIMPYIHQSTAKLILHNSKFDAHMLLKEGIDIRDSIYGDTMIMQVILNENEDSFALKKLANKYGRFFGYEDKSYTFEELFGKSPENFRKADMTLATYYACKDTHLDLMFFEWQVSMMKKQPNLYHVYFDIERLVTPACIDMEDTGFNIDFKYASQYSNRLALEIMELEKKIEQVFEGINVNSPKQLSELLFDKWGLKDISGKGSVGAKILEKLVKEKPEIQLILDVREKNKLLNTYVAKLPTMVRPDTQRLSGEFNQAGTVTGRFSSSNPNLQNLPYPARPLITAPDGKIIIGLDYSQVEPRSLAHISEDMDLRHPYEVGIDLYSTLAAKTFNMTYESCLEADDETWRKTGLPKHPRKMMKVGLLAAMYGITVPSLAESLKISVEEAQEFMDNFYAAYPRMVAWMDETVKFAEVNGYVLTKEGKKRRLMVTIKDKDFRTGDVKVTVMPFPQAAKEYHSLKRKVEGFLGRKLKDSDNIWQLDIPKKLKRAFWRINAPYQSAARQAVNAVIQGSAAEIMKIAMIKARDYIKQFDGWKLLCTIHDELLFEIPDTATEEQIRGLEALMVNAVKLDIPLKCDIEVSKAWGKGVPYADWKEKGYEAFAA